MRALERAGVRQPAILHCLLGWGAITAAMSLMQIRERALAEQAER